MAEVIVGIDGSERSEDALAFACRLGGATVTLAAAYPYEDWPTLATGPEYREFLREETVAILDRMRASLNGGDVTAHALADRSPARALHHLAEHEGAALIVVGSTHRGKLGRVMPGSTADRLLHGSPCPVAVVPRQYRTREPAPIRTVGVGYDGSEESP
jgi:nucleotide-binding universal stress UspA family protein